MKKGLTPARKVGSGPDNKALSAHTIASGYGTALASGDPVKFSAGNIVKATNGANALGILASLRYVATDGRIIDTRYWPASTTVMAGTTVDALVLDDPNATFFVIGDGVVTQVAKGNLYALNLTGTPDANIGRSVVTANVTASITGSLAVVGTNNAALTGLANTDAFTIKSSVANTATTITIVTNQTPAQLLALLNAVPGITASLNASNFLVVAATDGGSIVLTDGTGTPLADSTLLTTAGTTTATVAAGSALVEVVSVVDTDNKILEVILSRHQFRDNDA